MIYLIISQDDLRAFITDYEKSKPTTSKRNCPPIIKAVRLENKIMISTNITAYMADHPDDAGTPGKITNNTLLED